MRQDCAVVPDTADPPALDRQLDSFAPQRRREALSILLRRVQSGEEALAKPGTDVNLHAHTFFSYNAYGYSPSKYAWLARKAGLCVAGIADLDVLDGLDEFLEAGHLLELKTCVSLESRVFVPEFAKREINSPGEPGIAYHIGVGFPAASRHPFLARLRNTAARRTRDMVKRINPFMRPVELDYEQDVVPTTPNGNVTERHVCEAYERKAERLFPHPAQRAAFWQDKLGDAPPTGPKLQNLIRATTMKKGGVGYVQPGRDSFPLMTEMNRVLLELGAIPTLAWLDGTSEGESGIEEFIQTAKSSGVAALNIIPDRNYTPGVKDEKLRNLQSVLALAERHHFPVVVGTEMNSPGHKFVDSFATAELKPFIPTFLRGAHIVYAHSVMQRECGLGYLSRWAAECFATAAAKNDFYEELGRELRPAAERGLRSLDAGMTPEEALAKVR